MNTSLSPYRTLYSLVSSDWETFISHAANAVHLKGFNQFSDSCVSTCMAISTLYLGVQKTRAILENLVSPSLQKFKIVLIPNHSVSYLIWDLFSGIRGDTRAYNKSIQEFQQQVNSLARHVSLEIQKSNMDAVEGFQRFDHGLLQLEFKFNYRVIKNLERELIASCDFVNARLSYLFVVGIRFQKILDHVFALELYFSPISGKPQIRLLHSWINTVSFIDTIQSRGYGEGDEGTWGVEEIPQFIQLLHHALEPSILRTKDIYQKCFGCGSCDLPLTRLEMIDSTKVLSGINLRYFPYPFSPGDCQKNLEAIFQKQRAVEAY